MKRLLAILIAVVTVFAFTACGGSSSVTLEGNIIDDKNMEIKANKADPGDFMMSGQLVLEDGEQLYYDHELESGEIDIEFLPVEEEESAEELPDYEDEDAAFSLELTETGGGSAFFASGSYMVKVTAGGDDKAVGTVILKIKKFEE